MVWPREGINEQENLQVSLKLQEFSHLIERHPEFFVSGNQSLSAISLQAVKYVFDLSIDSEPLSKPHINNLISSLEPSYAPQTRSQMQPKGEHGSQVLVTPKATFETTPITSLFVEGMTEDQIWAQLELKTNNLCDILDLALEVGGDEEEGEEEEDDIDISDGDVAVPRLQDMGLEGALKELEEGEEHDLNDVKEELKQAESEEDTYDHFSSGGEEDQFDIFPGDLTEGTNLRGASSSPSSNDDGEGGQITIHPEKSIAKPSRKKSMKNSLDDGFFDLASFNAEIKQAEALSSSKGRLAEPTESDDDDDDDMSIDLFTSIHDESIGDDDLGDIHYDGFFEPPMLASKSSLKKRSEIVSLAVPPGRVRFHDEVRVREIQSSTQNFPFSRTDENIQENGNPEDVELESSSIESDKLAGDSTRNFHDAMDVIDENEYERQTIERLKEDLFDEEDDAIHQNLSTHERRLAALQEQISELESENIGPKDWVLMGEADSRMRPQNSLLEEDFEFERVTKTVPVITEADVRVLEERIKARITDNRFDDVVRIRPVEDKAFLPSRFLDLTDKKSVHSLAQIYEDEFIATQGENTAGDDRDGKSRKERAEIEHMWENICSKLDALCNTHFMPKQATSTISTVSNASSATLESALPTTKSVTDIFAPEEVFSTVSDGLRARSELTPIEKRALRAKTRKAKKKSRDALAYSVDKYARVKGIGGIKNQKRAALENVVKSGRGVTVVGKERNLLVKQRSKTLRPPRN